MERGVCKDGSILGYDVDGREKVRVKWLQYVQEEVDEEEDGMKRETEKRERFSEPGFEWKLIIYNKKKKIVDAIAIVSVHASYTEKTFFCTFCLPVSSVSILFTLSIYSFLEETSSIWNVKNADGEGQNSSRETCAM